MKKLSYLFVLLCVSGWVVSAQANIILTDDASNYGGAWNDGDNPGDGFNAWSITSNGGTGGFAGTIAADSSAGLGGSTALNTAGVALGIFQNQATDGFVQADRFFANGPLQVGESFSIDLGVNFRNGFRGLNILSSSTNFLFTFLVGDVGGGDDYLYEDNANAGGNTTLGLGYQSDSIFSLTFAQTTAFDLAVQIVRNSVGGGLETPLNSSFTISDVSGLRLFMGNNGNDDGSPDDFYANNLSLSIVPEPATLGLILSGLGLLSLLRRFRS